MNKTRVFAVTSVAAMAFAVAPLVHARDIRVAYYLSWMYLAPNKLEAFHSFNALWSLADETPLPASVEWGDVDMSGCRAAPSRRANDRIFLVQAYSETQNALHCIMLEKTSDGSFQVGFRWSKRLG
jgi:hypothetical protein